MNIKIDYYENSLFLSKNEWINLIKSYLNTIKKTNVGNILLEKINNHIANGANVKILNYSNDKIFQYPFCKIVTNKLFEICIPDTPYFVKVPVLNEDLIKEVLLDDNLSNIQLRNPISNPLSNEIIKSFSHFEFQPIVVMLFHELIHCLRKLENLDDLYNEEECTIYGIKSKTLRYENMYITENTFRKELDLPPRLSHSSEFMYVHGDKKDKNRKNSELKNLFKLINAN
tara:strand:- start:1366 stop:2052 length:687 start_codon:yes stop_codon:yes gene_type:complete